MTKEIKHPTIGETYECLDICGMLAHKMKYLGMGGTERFNDKSGTWNRASFGHSYVFERVIETDYDKRCYRYAVATPIFRGLEWSGGFQVTHYSNELEDMFKPNVVVKTRFVLVDGK